MQSLWQDLRYGMRGMRANPGFSALAMLTLALGIGAGTTMFSVIKNVLMSPFPYKDASGLRPSRSTTWTAGGRAGGGLQSRGIPGVPTQKHVFSEDTGGGNEDVLWTTPEGTEQFDGAYVTPNSFSSWVWRRWWAAESHRRTESRARRRSS